MEPFDDPVMGRLVWNERFNEWQGELVTPAGVRVETSVDCERNAVSLAARKAFAWLGANEYELRVQLAEQMLDMANHWRNESEAEITTEEFAARVRLDGASFGDDGQLSLTYYDGDMFGGHGIAATLTADREVEDAHIFG